MAPGPQVNISVRLDNFQVEVEFAAPSGITALLGPSGAGKTTVLRAIAGVLKPDAGRIVLGERVFFDSERGINLRIQDRRVGLVFQNSALFPHMTAEQNVAYGLARRERTARDWLALFGIEEVAGRLPRQLSSGEGQRVALARALASQPDLLLLDEPVSALDAATRAQMVEAIASAHERTGIPFLYVTHQLEEARKLGGYGIFLEHGRVARQGPL